MLFTKLLENQEAEEGGTVTLSCEISKQGAPVQWKKDRSLLRPGDKYRMKQVGVVVELTIGKLSAADAGEYTCDTGDHQTAAALLVKGRALGYLSEAIASSTEQNWLYLCEPNPVWRTG